MTLLGYLGQDSTNLILRLDATREACDVGQWDTAQTLVDEGLKIHPGQRELLALSGLVHLQAWIKQGGSIPTYGYSSFLVQQWP